MGHGMQGGRPENKFETSLKAWKHPKWAAYRHRQPRTMLVTCISSQRLPRSDPIQEIVAENGRGFQLVAQPAVHVPQWICWLAITSNPTLYETRPRIGFPQVRDRPMCWFPIGNSVPPRPILYQIDVFEKKLNIGALLACWERCWERHGWLCSYPKQGWQRSNQSCRIVQNMMVRYTRYDDPYFDFAFIPLRSVSRGWAQPSWGPSIFGHWCDPRCAGWLGCTVIPAHGFFVVCRLWVDGGSGRSTTLNVSADGGAPSVGAPHTAPSPPHGCVACAPQLETARDGAGRGDGAPSDPARYIGCGEGGEGA